MVKRVGILIAALVGVFLTLEIGARVYLDTMAGPEQFRRYASHSQLQRAGSSSGSKSTYVQHRYLGYYPRPNHDDGENRHNSLGFRGEEIENPKPAGEFRIVCLGGSTTYTSAIRDYRLAYPYLLEEALRGQGYDHVRVINGGSPGWSSYESLISLQLRVMDLQPDLVVVYHAINDVDARMVWPPESYLGDNSGRRMANLSTFSQASILESSTLLRYMLVKSGHTKPHSAFQRTVDAPPQSYVADDFLEQKQDGSYPSGVFDTASASQVLAGNPPTYFRRNLEDMVVLARASGVHVVFCTFSFSPQFPAEPRSSSPEYIQALNEMNRVVVDVANRTGSGLIDLAGSTLSSKKYYVDGIHVNHDGSRLKAALVARGLIRIGEAGSPR